MQVVFFEVSSSVITLGKMPGTVKAGDSYTIRPVFVYTNNGESKTLKLNITYNFK